MNLFSSRCCVGDSIVGLLLSSSIFVSSSTAQAYANWTVSCLYSFLLLTGISLTKHFSVATRLRCGGIFNNCFIANKLEIVTMKEFRKTASRPFMKLFVECRGLLCLALYIFALSHSARLVTLVWRT